MHGLAHAHSTLYPSSRSSTTAVVRPRSPALALIRLRFVLVLIIREASTGIILVQGEGPQLDLMVLIKVKIVCSRIGGLCWGPLVTACTTAMTASCTRLFPA